MDSINRLAMVLAAADQATGLIHRDDLAALGVSPSSLRRLMQSGLLEKMGAGWYRNRHQRFDFDTNVRASSKIAGPRAAIGFQTAARLWGLEFVPKGRVHLVAPRWNERRNPRFDVHESLDLIPSDIARRKGMRVTTIERTLIDMARFVHGPPLARAVDVAVNRELTSHERIATRFLELARRGRPGVRAMRACLADRSPLIRPEVNGYEWQFEQVVKMGGFPEPIRQYRVDTPSGFYFLDHAWPDHETWAECDSLLAHGTAEYLHADLCRQNDIVLMTAWMPLRFTYWSVFRHPQEVIARLAQRLPTTLDHPISSNLR